MSLATMAPIGYARSASTRTGVSVPAVADEVVTGSAGPMFGIVRPAVPNTRVDFSPYRQSVFADVVDAVQSVDLAYGALINEIDAQDARVPL